jgi:hypothetical protein
VAMVTGQGAVGRVPQVVEKIDEIDGVLRVRQARIIEFLDA